MNEDLSAGLRVNTWAQPVYVPTDSGQPVRCNAEVPSFIERYPIAPPLPLPDGVLVINCDRPPLPLPEIAPKPIKQKPVKPSAKRFYFNKLALQVLKCLDEQKKAIPRKKIAEILNVPNDKKLGNALYIL